MADINTSEKLWESKDFAQKYRSAEKLMGQMGEILLQQMELSSTYDNPLVALDSACGTGVITAKLIELLGHTTSENLHITALDLSESMIMFLRERINHSGWKNVTALVGDSQEPKFPDAHFTHIVTNFSMMFFPKSLTAISENYRMLKPGGFIATSTWKKPGWFAVVRAAFETDPSLPAFPPDSQIASALCRDGQWDNDEWITQAFQKQGFVDIKTQIVTKKSGVYIKDFLRLNRGTVKMIMENFWNEPEREKYTEGAYTAVEKYVASEYSDGYAEWDWTAILATGRKPF